MAPSPTAQACVPLLHPLRSSFDVPLDLLVHALPFQCTIVPPRPTAQTSVAELPQTPLRLFVVPLATLDQALPFISVPVTAG